MPARKLEKFPHSVGISAQISDARVPISEIFIHIGRRLSRNLYAVHRPNVMHPRISRVHQSAHDYAPYPRVSYTTRVQLIVRDMIEMLRMKSRHLSKFSDKFECTDISKNILNLDFFFLFFLHIFATDAMKISR